MTNLRAPAARFGAGRRPGSCFFRRRGGGLAPEAAVSRGGPALAPRRDSGWASFRRRAVPASSRLGVLLLWRRRGGGGGGWQSLVLQLFARSAAAASAGRTQRRHERSQKCVITNGPAIKL